MAHSYEKLKQDIEKTIKDESGNAIHNVLEARPVGANAVDTEIKRNLVYHIVTGRSGREGINHEIAQKAAEEFKPAFAKIDELSSPDRLLKIGKEAGIVTDTEEGKSIAVAASVALADKMKAQVLEAVKESFAVPYANKLVDKKESKDIGPRKPYDFINTAFSSPGDVSASQIKTNVDNALKEYRKEMVETAKTTASHITARLEETSTPEALEDILKLTKLTYLRQKATLKEEFKAELTERLKQELKSAHISSVSDHKARFGSPTQYQDAIVKEISRQVSNGINEKLRTATDKADEKVTLFAEAIDKAAELSVTDLLHKVAERRIMQDSEYITPMPTQKELQQRLADSVSRFITGTKLRELKISHNDVFANLETLTPNQATARADAVFKKYEEDFAQAIEKAAKELPADLEGKKGEELIKSIVDMYSNPRDREQETTREKYAIYRDDQEISGRQGVF